MDRITLKQQKFMFDLETAGNSGFPLYGNGGSGVLRAVKMRDALVKSGLVELYHGPTKDALRLSERGKLFLSLLRGEKI